MALFLARQHSSDLDSVVEYLPEAVIDRLLERKAAKLKEQAGEAAITQQQDDPGQSLSFDELVALAQPSDLVLDAYSARGVLNAAPRSATALSSLKLAPDRFLQRYEVATQSGEEMMLTFDMQLEEALVPKYRGLQVVKRWFLKGITGEPAHPGDLPAKPEPCWGPEAVVQAQLAALQEGGAGRIFRFASPGNRRATGPVERFAQMLQAPLYRPLLRHLSADLLRTVQMQPDLTLLIVGVRSNIPTAELGVTQGAVYSWTLRLQQDEGCQGCWMTESVQPISQNLFKM
ncbi:hypothetical protein CHLNCDRAFT_56464 [Chlorella variabilis]|uniref:DUF4864 domain-containing protein n=1 Tax=Chlorella variabilis TaxID=554065 RepID=E1Z259_CHLVA|nr:hypothetical protein CHLNCDRAFT_56464 [Chlorella variabilis]EFN59604.1 hypothetical protein CHLNCDRAFT_56464 [Chlorella variabilis]|eukprot:XP_005851706.1 hypothetical protein CHLNCDRAFT_56464 [Chlorella variabilis]